jgi:hypothetical protein
VLPHFSLDQVKKTPQVMILPKVEHFERWLEGSSASASI